ncbi:glycosyltransferase family 2 protein, partial [bacterium]|nr:glycosyltransferase family 2 protein [bacterium]
PFYHPLREAADQWLMEYGNALLKTPNPMLQEHLQNGLPEAAVLEAHLKEQNCDYFSFPNGHLGFWRLIMAVKHLILLSSGPESCMNFEQDTLPWAESTVLEGPGYRDVYVILKNGCSANLSLFKTVLAQAKRTIRNKRRSQEGQTIETICSSHLQIPGLALREFAKIIQQQNMTNHEIRLEQLRLKTIVKSTRFQLDRIHQHARKLGQDIREKDLYIHQLLEREKQKDEAAGIHINEYERGLEELRSSSAYRAGKIVLAPLKMAVKLARKSEGQVTKPQTISTPDCSISKTVPDSRLLTLSHQNTFSILVPVYNTDNTVLRAMLDSVLAQTYPYWQLCLVDDSSPENSPREIIAEYAQVDPERIHYTFATENKGIAVATRKAADIATGEFVCLLDHDDLLDPDALMEIARQLDVTPDADYIYSDENKISNDGTEYSQPYYKPDFDPDLLLCNNYLNHFSVIRKTLFDKIGGYREGFDGSQDYDLYLRVTENAREIAHVAKILYHWRMVPESTAVDPAAKGGLYRDSSFRVLESAIERRNLNAVVEKGLSPGTYRVRYHVEPEHRVSIIIPTRNAVELVEHCVSTIEKYTLYPDYEIIVVDNGSDDRLTLEYLDQKTKESKRFKCLKFDRRFNFSEINNYAVKNTDAPYLLFLNNDIEITDDGWLTAMLEHAQRSEIGAVGAKLLYPDGRIQHAGVILGQGGIAGHPFKEMPEYNGVYFGHSNLVKNYSAVTAACLLTRRDVFQEAGGFNEELAVSFGDIDFCMEIRRLGYRIVYTPYARIIHHESVSRLDDNDASRRPRFQSEITYMISKWGNVLYNDPYLNHNLSILKYDMSPREPSENATLDAFRKAFSGFIPGM